MTDAEALRRIQARQDSNLQPPVLESWNPYVHRDTLEHNGAQNPASAQACSGRTYRTAQMVRTLIGHSLL
jgi:hypothetical protein